MREIHNIFLRKEKFKFIKKIIFRKYKNVFLNFSNELSINVKIIECNNKKEKLRFEKQNFINDIEKLNRKISSNKITLSKVKKSIINIDKNTEFCTVRIQCLNNYNELETKFRNEVLENKKLNKRSLKNIKM